MNDDDKASLLAPKIFRFTDIDQFRSAIRNVNVDFVPFACWIAAEQTILGLPGCEVTVTKTFPRILDVQLGPNCTAIGFAMDDYPVPMRFNGVQMRRSVIVLGSNGAAYSSVEDAEREMCSIVFSPEVTNRGWPETHLNFGLFETSDAAMRGLRRMVRELLAAASEPVDAVHAPIRASAMKEALMLCLDSAFADVLSTRWASRASDPRLLKVCQDVSALLSSAPGQPIYSEELARKVGVSVRTLHDVVQRHRGMSLHRYLRLWRLWHVRKRLLVGAESVKAVALAFGFWHLSDFSRSYRQQFGETPSQTLARARQG
jgi:AraC family ethanolamine operon transcriptional activator